MNQFHPGVTGRGDVQKIYRSAQLPEITGYCIGYLYQLISENKFPKPIRLGARAVGWLESDILEWQRQRIAGRDSKAA